MAEAQGLDNQTGKEPVGKSLKPFSDADIIGELSRRFHANPQLDPTVLGKFDTVTAEIKEKLKPEEPKTDLKPPAEPGSVEAQTSSESEGKKWADILRREGGAFLSGKFATRSWTFIDHEGKRVMLDPDSIGAPGSRHAGSIGKNIAWDIHPMRNKYDPAISLVEIDDRKNKRYENIGNCGNRLIITDNLDKSGEKIGVAFNYLMANTNTPDDRLIPNPIAFIFTLPPNRAEELIAIIKGGNVDVIEHIFQNTYPCFTGTGENQARRLIAQKMEIVNLLTDSNIDSVPKEVKFSVPVGEDTALKAAKESGNAEVQAPSESEGKGWAKIIREKGAGFLFGKFKNSWGYYDENGSFHGIEPQGQDSRETAIGETNAGLFGKSGIPVRGALIEVASSGINTSGVAGGSPIDTSSNFLVIVEDIGRDRNERDGFRGWKTFRYSTWYNLRQVGGNAGTVVRDLQFTFTLPPEESSQFIEGVDRNPDLIESTFQNVYPRFIKENGPKRIIVNTLTVIDNMVTKEIENREINEWNKNYHPEKPIAYETVMISKRNRVVNFSKPVGEVAP